MAGNRPRRISDLSKVTQPVRAKDQDFKPKLCLAASIGRQPVVAKVRTGFKFCLFYLQAMRFNVSLGGPL